MYYCCGYKDHSRPPSSKLPYIYGCYVTIWEPKVTQRRENEGDGCVIQV